MGIKINTAIVFTIAIILATGIVISSGLNSSAFAQNTKFNAKLSGQEEVSPTESKATGMAEFIPSGESVSYNVNATNIQGLTAGHTHSAKKAQMAGDVVTLF